MKIKDGFMLSRVAGSYVVDGRDVLFFYLEKALWL